MTMLIDYHQIHPNQCHNFEYIQRIYLTDQRKSPSESVLNKIVFVGSMITIAGGLKL